MKTKLQNHRAICSCPANFLGDPFSRCYPECTQHEECASNLACFNLKCTNPCSGACGDNADCRVENHKAICSCPKGYTGHPFDRCRPFTKSNFHHQQTPFKETTSLSFHTKNLKNGLLDVQLDYNHYLSNV